MASYNNNNNNNMDNNWSASDSDEETGYSVEFLDGTFECVICKLTIRELIELPCGHAGCKSCIQKWENTSV